MVCSGYPDPKHPVGPDERCRCGKLSLIPCNTEPTMTGVPYFTPRKTRIEKYTFFVIAVEKMMELL